MSHFTVMVIGDDPEGQLEPFDENKEMEEYVSAEVGPDEIEKFLHYYATHEVEHGNRKIKMTREEVDKLGFEEMYERFGDDWNGARWRKDADGKWKEYSTYNPESKWDWYSLGGRWTGYFKLKPGADGCTGRHGIMTDAAKEGYADAARKGDIDFEGMRQEAMADAGERWQKVDDLTREHKASFIPWPKMLEKYGLTENGVDVQKDTIDLAREEYHKQPALKALRDADLFLMDFEKFTGTKEAFMENARKHAVSTWAFLRDGEWVEHGQMGWFGMSSNEMEEESWLDLFNRMLDDLSDDTLLSVYDCHI